MKRQTPFSKQSGYTLVEITVALGVMAVVMLVGAQAYNYFNKETQSKVSELNTVQQFNLLTKDMLGFSESAGLSTLYLNMPVRSKDCEANRPCLRQKVSEAPANCPEGETCRAEDKWVDAPAAAIPRNIANEKCLQFYRESHGKPLDKPAFPDTPDSTDRVGAFRNFNYTPGDTELFLNWPLVDENSAPMLLLKVRNVSDYFSLNAALSFSHASLKSFGSDNDEFRSAVFDSNMTPDQASQYVGFPMMFYGSQNQGHFGFYYAHSITACRDNISGCLTLIGDKIYQNGGANLPQTLIDGITATSFVINLRKINQEDSFFADIYSRVNVPQGTGTAGCQYSWGGKQSAEQYIFPNGLLSVYNAIAPATEVNPDPLNYFNPISYTKYAAYEMPNSSKVAPYGQLMPVDLIRYSVEKSELGDGSKLDLVARLWHATEEKKLLKITNLTSPFYFNRKLGSSEFGIEYSPKVGTAPAAAAATEEAR